jgi:hypothetical protein
MSAEEKSLNVEQRTLRQVRSLLLMVVGLALVMGGFVAAAPWLRENFGATMLSVASLALVVLVLGVTEYFAQRYNRGLDEVQKASQGFAVRWGASAGQIVFILLLMLPPFHDFAASLIHGFVGDAEMSDHDRVVALAMVFGFGSLVLLQTIGTFVFGAIWWTRSQR